VHVHVHFYVYPMTVSDDKTDNIAMPQFKTEIAFCSVEGIELNRKSNRIELN